MEADLWDIVKTALAVIVMPLVGGIMHFVKKSFNRLDKVENELNEQKTRTAVIESKVDDLRDDIKEIKQNVQKLVERQTK